MKRSKKLLMAGVLTLGMGTGAVLFTPQGMNASGNVVLASVDWVTSQLNPVKTKISELESKLAAQQQEINNLKAQIGDTTNPPTTPPTGQLPSVVYAKGTVSVHSGATKDYKVIATKPAGSSLKVIDSFTGSSGLWYRVELSSTVRGWVYSGDVSTTKPATTTPTQVVTTGDVHLRKGATTSYPVIETLKAGTTHKYISTFTNSAGEKWYNIETTSGNKGWVFSGLSEVK
jgi:uncharacterized protein YgiM (DUF1202 family)